MKPMNVLQKQRLAALPFQCSIRCTRFLSTSPTAQDARHPDPKTPRKPHDIDPRWLTTTKRRIGKCMMFGLKPPQVQEAGDILQQIARDWRELIAGSHVNNVTYVRYAETARVYFTRNYAMHIDPAHKKEWMNLVSSRGIGVILRSIKIDYKFPMTYPDKVTVYHKLAHDPDSPHSSQHAFFLQAIILSESRQRPAARVHEDLVTYDYKLGRKTALPPFLMEQFKSTWELQEQAKKAWRERILEIEDRVRTLEVESWDREDAVEDTGSGGQ
ncbi:thioesterase family protein [Aspergillus melleus]|uniref:thioesterase family protein n=1 Tax=Aspergillus melleus TaxID=138277 RepID=UPI001E8EC9C0|nr:uncharacterized protein LDX57_005672 [Aspergillus melleus]KAH8427966.1 hypothetical protein LDX57_005672 [Aspergillus melleus]